MKNYAKRMMSICLSSLLLIGACSVAVSAEEAQQISINGNQTEFVEIFKVENGVTYLPIRIAFTDFQEQGYIVQVDPSIDYKNIRIAVVKVDEETNVIRERRAVYINWEDRVTNEADSKNGRIELYQYEKDENGNNYLPQENYRRPIPLNNELIFMDVDNNGGQRAFMSLSDLNVMVQFLIDDANYTVKLQ